MMSKREILEWLNTLPDEAEIGIDEGGLCLQMFADEAYIEIGGLPEDEGDEV